MSEWVEFTRRDEQIAEMVTSKNGFIVKANGKEWPMVFTTDTPLMCHLITHYWIIPDDPLREMKIRQAMTGQLVYIDLRKCIYPYQADPDDSVLSVIKDGRAVEIGISTCNPKWNIPNAEYSFRPFEE